MDILGIMQINHRRDEDVIFDLRSSLFLDASYLRYPTHQTIQVLGEEFAHLVKKQGEMVKELREVFHQDINENGVSYGFTDVEIGKITRLYDWMIAPQDEEQLKTNRKIWIVK